MSPAVLLFDIDGTLVTTGGAGSRAMRRAFATLYGHADAIPFRLDGMTDPAILRRALLECGVAPEPAALQQCLATYLQFLAEELAATPAGKHRLHPGMREVVLEARRRGHAVGLGTGNVREGARLKLEPLDVFHAFDFGGFGDDAEVRAEIIEAGARRGLERLGVARARVVVIGDTPSDVSAAQAIGAECVAVATGSFSVAQLREAGATWAFADLAEPEAVRVVLG